MKILLCFIFAVAANLSANTDEMLRMTASKLTTYLKDKKELSGNAKEINGVGGVVLYKISDDYYQVSEYSCQWSKVEGMFV